MQNNMHPRDLGPQEAMLLLARLKPSPTLTSQASSSALHKLSKVLPFIHVSDEGPHLPAEVIRAAKVTEQVKPRISGDPCQWPLPTLPNPPLSPPASVSLHPQMSHFLTS